MFRHAAHLLLIASVAGSVGAQTPTARMADADRLYAARDARGALTAYESIVASQPSNREALAKAARSATDLAEFETSDSVRTGLFGQAQQFAERAVKIDSTNAESQFQLARAIGRVALKMSAKDRVRLAGTVRAHALVALAHDKDHAGALHVLGVWNAEIMRIGGFERTMAKAFLGGKVLSEANWSDAIKFLEHAVAIEPNRIVHHLDLGLVYKDTKKRDLARAQFTWIAAAPVTDYNDPHYKKLAEEALRKLK